MKDIEYYNCNDPKKDGYTCVIRIKEEKEKNVNNKYKSFNLELVECNTLDRGKRIYLKFDDGEIYKSWSEEKFTQKSLELTLHAIAKNGSEVVVIKKF